jgi:hypothetical protein
MYNLPYIASTACTPNYTPTILNNKRSNIALSSMDASLGDLVDRGQQSKNLWVKTREG